jgi:predicted NBD/HSP70 family sugar kinase
MTKNARHPPLGLPASARARADQTTVRHANLGVVFRHVAGYGPCSRAAVATETGLTRGTVSSLVAELIELELVRETDGPAGPRGIGRPGVAIEVAGMVAAVGLEVNVDYLAVCVEDMRGDVRYEQRVLGDNRGSSSESVLDRVASMAAEALAAAAAEGLHVAGLALAAPGLVCVATGTLLHAPNLGWHDLEVAAELRERLDTALPIHVDNEANLAAIAEHWRGAAQGLRSFLLVFGEVGVGGGIFVDGELFRGAHGYGGEIGHITVDQTGAACACGSNGCLETLVGQDAIAARAGIAVGGEDGTRSITSEIVRRASEGDTRTLGALAEAGATLGSVLASTVNLFDFEGVVLGGAYGPLAPWLTEPVGAALREHVLAGRWTSCELRVSTLGEGAAVRGAAAFTLRSVLATPWVVATEENRRAVAAP